jgi:hypothetical protein
MKKACGLKVSLKDLFAIEDNLELNLQKELSGLEFQTVVFDNGFDFDIRKEMTLSL